GVVDRRVDAGVGGRGVDARVGARVETVVGATGRPRSAEIRRAVAVLARRAIAIADALEAAASAGEADEGRGAVRVVLARLAERVGSRRSRVGDGRAVDDRTVAARV